MTRTRTPTPPDADVAVDGRVAAEEIEYARDKIRNLSSYTREPIVQADVKFTDATGRAGARPVFVRANVDVDGRILRAHVAGATSHEAIDLLYERLRVRLGRMSRHWEARRGGQPTPAAHEWRHGFEPEDRPSYWPRPPEQRQILRHKAYELARAAPDEAVFDMEQLDYDFHLFTDLGSGQDAVVYRSGPTGYRLARLHPACGPEPVSAVPLTVSSQNAPQLSVAQAIDRLNLSGQPFLFYGNAATSRGRVLYRRYDGHYGLIRPADDSAEKSS